MKRCIKLVTAKASLGSGVQTVTDIVDPTDGLPFEGKFAWLIAGYFLENTFRAWFNYNQGFDNAVVHHGMGTGEIEQFGTRIASSGGGNRSLVDIGGNAFFGGDIFRKAYVSAFRSGELDITYDTNDRTGDVFILVVVGGTDLSVAIGEAVAGATSTTFEPKGIIFKNQLNASSSPTVSGGGLGSFGLAANDYNNGTLDFIMESPGGPNGRYQRVDKAVSRLSSSTVVAAEAAVTAWDPTGFTLGAGVFGASYAAFGGADIRAASGNEVQEIATGEVDINTGIACRLFIAASVGKTAGTTIDTTQAEISIGVFDGTNQLRSWAGESQSLPSLTGARYVDQAGLLGFATPAAGATTFNSSLTGVSVDTHTGIVKLNWASTDGALREWFWLALGEGVEPPLIPPIAGCVPSLPN